MSVDGRRKGYTMLCEPCREGNLLTKADGYCIDCEEYMCQACFESHLKLKVCRNHVLGGLDIGRGQAEQKLEIKCKKHTTEVIKYYCHSHDSVGCGDCLVAFHQKCETQFITKIAPNIEESTDFKNFLKEVDDLEVLTAAMETSLERNRGKNTESHDKAIHAIQQCRTEFNTWLNKVTEKMESEEMKVWNDNERRLPKLEDWIKTTNDMTKRLRDEISNSKYIVENLFIRVIEGKSELKEFNTKTLPQIKSSLEVKSFSFEPNKHLLELKKSANLGVITEEVQTIIPERKDNGRPSTGASPNAKDPPHTGFELGKRVRHLRLVGQGTVTAVDPSGYVDVRWDFTGRVDRHSPGEVYLVPMETCCTD